MREQKDIIVVFNEKAASVLSDIEKKYNLEENEEETLRVLEGHGLFRMNIIVKFTRDFATGKISAKEFAESLYKGLGVSKQTIVDVARDIRYTLIPLLEKVPEDKLQEYNRKKSKTERKSKNEEGKTEEKKREEFRRTKEELLKKIGAEIIAPEPQPEKTPPMPYVKKIPITSVEENAENMGQMGQNTITQQKESILAKGAVKKREEPQNKTSDSYREPVE